MPLEKTSKVKPRTPPPSSKNGRVLTVKNLPEEVYQAFHCLPHGVRQLTMEAVLLNAVGFAENFGPGWHMEFLAKHVTLSSASTARKPRKA